MFSVCHWLSWEALLSINTAHLTPCLPWRFPIMFLLAHCNVLRGTQGIDEQEQMLGASLLFDYGALKVSMTSAASHCCVVMFPCFFSMLRLQDIICDYWLLRNFVAHIVFAMSIPAECMQHLMLDDQQWHKEWLPATWCFQQWWSCWQPALLHKALPSC